MPTQIDNDVAAFLVASDNLLTSLPQGPHVAIIKSRLRLLVVAVRGYFEGRQKVVDLYEGEHADDDLNGAAYVRHTTTYGGV